MTPQTRRAVFRYGIAVDLVIVATGAAMLAPASPTLQVLLFTAVVALSTWKGGWKAGGVSLLLSILALAFAVEGTTATQIVAFAGAAFAAGAIVHAATAPAPARMRTSEPVAEVVAFARPQPVDEDDQQVWHDVARSLERTAAQQLEQLRINAERERREEEERAAREREAAERAAMQEAQRRAEEQRRAAEEAERARASAERAAAEERERHDAAKAAEELARLEADRLRLQRELEERLAREREEAARELQARVEAERKAAEEELRRQLEAEREALRVKLEQQLAAEREAIEREAAAKVEAARKAATAPSITPAPPPAKPAPRVEKKTTVLDTVTSWLRRIPRASSVNLVTNKVAQNARTASRPAPKPAVRRTTSPGTRKPRALMIERRRGSADVIMPRLRNRAIEVEVVERWVDAVDEIFRFKPDVIFLDVEHPEFDKIHRTLTEKSGRMPIVLTGRSASSAPPVKHAAFAVRPFELDVLERYAHQAYSKPEELLALQTMTRTKPTPAPAPVQPAAAPKQAARAPKPAAPAPPRQRAKSDTSYEVTCYSCRAPFDAIDADWCSCLAKERTLVCTNCLSCFCKAPPAFKEKFWLEAPPRLFERKTAEARRQQEGLPSNPSPDAVTRPLVLTVEDDVEIQAIVQRICNNLGYGFIHAMNGQDGFELAHEYRPNLILSDAFMPKLDGREMCRLLKQDPAFADTKMVVMTGLYTDTKYRSEALKRFHVDDYLSKPVAVTDLINILQKHLEGVSGLPAQEDLHELHRQHVDRQDVDHSPEAEEEIPIAELLAPPPPAAAPQAHDPDRYDVCCFNCHETFDAAHADWCSCVGRDQTVVCRHCNGCFCKAPAAYKERFWMDAPPTLFERKMLGSKRNVVARENPAPQEVKRPLILLVEDDENVQLIVRTVVTTMGYGFVVGANGQEGLTLAREYGPDLILSDAFMPKLDGREMCRLLKEDPTTSRSKAIIMTGLYTDRKYRNEALDYFKVDDYVAKPLAVDDLIKLFKKHLPQEVSTPM